MVPRGQRDWSPRPFSRLSRPEPLRFYQVALHLYSRGWVDPVPDPLLLRKSDSAGNRTRTSGSVEMNSDRWTTESMDRKTRGSVLNGSKHLPTVNNLSKIISPWRKFLRNIFTFLLKCEAKGALGTAEINVPGLSYGLFLFPVTKNFPHSINWSVAILSAMVLNVYGAYSSSAPKWGEGGDHGHPPPPPSPGATHATKHAIWRLNFCSDGMTKIMLHVLKHPVPFLTVHVQHLKGIHSSLFILLQHYMCRSNWPSSSVRAVEKTYALLSHCYSFQICKMLLKYHVVIILLCARVV
jgi:hypothetical protein